MKLPQAAIFQSKKLRRNPASNPALTLAQKTLAETSQIKEKERSVENSQIKEKERSVETSQIKEKEKGTKPLIASFSEWLAKQKELIFDKTNFSFD